MIMTNNDFIRCINKVESLQNLRPTYIPDEQEIAHLAELTQTIREEENSDVYNHKTGRISEYETKQVFITPSKVGEPVVSEKDFFAFLIFLSETVEPDPKDPEGENKKKYLNRYLRENLQIN